MHCILYFCPNEHMQFDWQAFITYAYELSGLDVPQNLEIVVTTQAYFQRLGVLLQNTNQEYVSLYYYSYTAISACHFRPFMYAFTSFESLYETHECIS